MSSYWVYIAVFLAGFSTAMLVVYYTGEKSTVTIGKVKQKGGPGNVMDTDIELQASTKQDRKEKRDLRRAEKKLDKQLDSITNQNYKL